MDHALIKASHHLSELDIRVPLFGHLVRVCWFRVMFKEGDWFIRRHAHATYEFHSIARGECEVIHGGARSAPAREASSSRAPTCTTSQRPVGAADMPDRNGDGLPVEAAGTNGQIIRPGEW